MKIKDNHGWVTEFSFECNDLVITQRHKKINEERYICLNSRKEIKALIKFLKENETM